MTTILSHTTLTRSTDVKILPYERSSCIFGFGYKRKKTVLALEAPIVHGKNVSYVSTHAAAVRTMSKHKQNYEHIVPKVLPVRASVVLELIRLI